MHASQYHAFTRGRSTTSSSAHSSASPTTTSSPEQGSDSVITPDSEDDDGLHLEPKIEEVDEDNLNYLFDSKAISLSDPSSSPAPRKRGRPRKHPVVEQKKVSHARSKTGCGTCRRRKKKCDETKPFCKNCEKNNVVCDGYEPKQPWRSGKQKALVVRTVLPAELPMLVDGIDGGVDQLFFHHFTTHVGKVLSLTDNHNPFLELIVPMAMGHTGLMHSLLYLSGTCLIASEPAPKAEWLERQEHHSSKALRLLQQDLAESREAEGSTLVTIGDQSIAQALILCLQSVCAGDVTGSYRFHLNAMKEMLTHRRQSFPNEQLRQFILEFLLYLDYSSSITSLTNPLDQRSSDLMGSVKLPDSVQSQAGSLLGVMDGLFDFVSRIRPLRDHFRQRRNSGEGHSWDASILSDAFRIDRALRQWHCAHTPDSPRFAASLLYRQCTWIYLHRTVQLSKPSTTFKQAVDEGLHYMSLLPESDDASTQSILLMPLFLLGCAAFEKEQRPPISEAFQRLQDWSNLGNIKYARTIVEQMWVMMDEGREAETWDWEAMIAARGWDFLIA